MYINYMAKEPLLSICIPTYNRCECLQESVSKMLGVCSENNIHIYISDNASPDNTRIVGRSLADTYSFIHYYRHDINIGPDDNFEFVLKLANSKYKWLMSDTCYIDEIGTIMADLESTEWDCYILNGGDGTRHLYLPSKTTIYDNSISVMREIGWHLTWICCMIYNKRLVESLDFNRYKGSSFNQTALFFEPTANRECRVCFNSEFTVRNLVIEKESGWLNHVFDVMYRQWYLLVMSLPIYYPYEVKKKCIEDNARYGGLLKTYCHIQRRCEGKWKFGDVYRNRFFIKQAKGNICMLMLLGVCPVFLLKIVVSPISYFSSIVKKNPRTKKIGLRVRDLLVRMKII